MSKLMKEVIVIGGGPGGLSAALVLGRSRREVLVIDNGSPRNAVTTESHGFLTRDGTEPIELLRLAREQMRKYETVSIIDDFVKKIEVNQGRFRMMTQSGKVIFSRKVLVSTGLRDHIPPIPGFKAVYGKSVFPCPYCDGWERRDGALAVFGNTKDIVRYCKLIYSWSKDLVLFTNGPALLSDAKKNELANHHIRVVESKVKELQSENGMLKAVILEDGETIERESGFIMDTKATQASDIPEQLGISLNEQGSYETKEHGRTAVKGLYIIGDAAKRFTGLMGAAAEGYEAAVSMNHELVEEDW